MKADEFPAMLGRIERCGECDACDPPHDYYRGATCRSILVERGYRSDLAAVQRRRLHNQQRAIRR